MSADGELDCRKASRLLSVASERALSDEERLALAHHLNECLACRNFEEQLAVLHEASRRFGER